jgi:hypothetical protein
VTVLMIIEGIQPGPAVMTELPALFWDLFVSVVGNPFLVVLNPPMIRLSVKMIRRIRKCWRTIGFASICEALHWRSPCAAPIANPSIRKAIDDTFAIINDLRFLI